MMLATKTDRLYICCASPTDRVMVVDCATDTVIANIEVGVGPMYPAYDSTRNRVFIGCQDSTIWVLTDDSGGIAEAQAGRPVPSLQAQPNPLTDGTLIRLDVKQASPVVIYDAVGRRVRSLAAGLDGRGAVWDARDQSGRRVRAGVYYASVSHPGNLPRVQLLVVR
jgi:YVTN family beta-propeller protein